jgi:hypothetical protein
VVALGRRRRRRGPRGTRDAAAATRVVIEEGWEVGSSQWGDTREMMALVELDLHGRAVDKVRVALVSISGVAVNASHDSCSAAWRWGGGVHDAWEVATMALALQHDAWEVEQPA